MSNPLRGEAVLLAGDRVFTLVVDINALCAAQEATRLTMPDMLDAIGNGVDYVALRAMLWASLLRKHDVRLLDAGDIIGEAGINETYAAVMHAFKGAFPQVSEAAPDINPPERPVGTSSAG